MSTGVAEQHLKSQGNQQQANGPTKCENINESGSNYESWRGSTQPHQGYANVDSNYYYTTSAYPTHGYTYAAGVAATPYLSNYSVYPAPSPSHAAHYQSSVHPGSYYYTNGTASAADYVGPQSWSQLAAGTPTTSSQHVGYASAVAYNTPADNGKLVESMQGMTLSSVGGGSNGGDLSMAVAAAPPPAKKQPSWASIASQPAKPPPTATLHIKKKGMPPPPMILSKMKLDPNPPAVIKPPVQTPLATPMPSAWGSAAPPPRPMGVSLPSSYTAVPQGLPPPHLILSTPPPHAHLHPHVMQHTTSHPPPNLLHAPPPQSQSSHPNSAGTGGEAPVPSLVTSTASPPETAKDQHNEPPHHENSPESTNSSSYQQGPDPEEKLDCDTPPPRPAHQPRDRDEGHYQDSGRDEIHHQGQYRNNQGQYRSDQGQYRNDQGQYRNDQGGYRNGHQGQYRSEPDQHNARRDQQQERRSPISNAEPLPTSQQHSRSHYNNNQHNSHQQGSHSRQQRSSESHHYQDSGPAEISAPTAQDSPPGPQGENLLETLRGKNNYNPAHYELPPRPRFFVIKSYSEDDIHRSIKYEIWCSTDHGNHKLDQAFQEQTAAQGSILLFFSVNRSGHFCGVARMMSPVDYNASSSVWSQDKWKGQFRVQWIYVKDVPNQHLRNIILETNDNKPVTYCRDTTEVPYEKGLEVLEKIQNFHHSTSIFDDFNHYEQRQAESSVHHQDAYSKETEREQHRSNGYQHSSYSNSHHNGGPANGGNYNRRSDSMRKSDWRDHSASSSSGGPPSRRGGGTGGGRNNRHSQSDDYYGPAAGGPRQGPGASDYYHTSSSSQRGGSFHRSRGGYHRNNAYSNNSGYGRENGGYAREFSRGESRDFSRGESRDFSRGEYNRERDFGQSGEEREMGREGRDHGRQRARNSEAGDRGEGHSERGQGHSERSQGHSERGQGHSERGQGHSERGQGHSERGQGHSERGRAEDEGHQ